MPKNSDNKPAISAKNLSAGYNKRAIWQGANFSLGEAEFVAVLGPNGSGKSTLFRLLLGLQKPLKGKLELLGDEPKKASHYIGYVPQRRNIDSETTLAARELIKLGFNGDRLGINLGKKQADQRVNKVLDQVDARDLGDKSLGQLSGGELQRIFLAQALIGDPKILLLDEPLANLDLKRETELVQLIKRLATDRQMTVLLIAHDLNPLLPVIDSLIYVANHQVASGAPDEILTSQMLSKLYDSPVEVLKDSTGRMVIVGAREIEHHV